MPAPTRLLTTGRETMFPNDAHSQPASLRTMPVAPIHVTGCTVQSVYPANGRGVVKRSAAALGKLNQVSSCTSAVWPAVSSRDAVDSLGFLHSAFPGAFLLIPQDRPSTTLSFTRY